jgi:NADPH:quinone reductase-like Zn-dependent oxidoreductase
MSLNQNAIRIVRCVAAIAIVAITGTACGEQAESIRQYQFEPGANGYQLIVKQVPRPVAGANEVLVRVRATSLNRRDIYILNDQYGPGGSAAGAIPLSDGAGEVIAIGDGVTRFEVGDRVAGIFFEKWIDGPSSPEIIASARGVGPGGMLSEVIVSNEDALVVIPEHLSFEEAATLPCAAVTAWSGLFKRGNLQAGEYVLLEGTGGVSTFGLLFAAAAGAKPIITSSRDEKLARAKELGAFGTINYRENPDWQKEVRELTGGGGVNQVLEVGGKGTLPKALEALAFGGHVALIGGLTGFGGDLPVGSLMLINAAASGIYVGSRKDFEDMNAFISKHQIRPVIGKAFEFDKAAEAFALMDSGDFMGKIVIRL